MHPKTLLTTLLAGRAALAAIIPIERNAAAVNPVNVLDAPGSNLNPISGLPTPHGRKHKHKHHKFRPGSINPISGLPAPGARIHLREAAAEPEAAENYQGGKHPQHQRHGKGKSHGKDPRIQPGINPINGLPAPGSPVYDRPHHGKGQGKNDKRPHNGKNKGDKRPQNGKGKDDNHPQNGQGKSDNRSHNSHGKDDKRLHNGQGGQREGQNHPAKGNHPKNGQGKQNHDQNRPINGNRPHKGEGNQNRPANDNRPHNNDEGDHDGKRPHNNDNKPNRPHHNGPTRTHKPQGIIITPLTTITVDGRVTSVPIRSKGAPNNGPAPRPLTEHAPPHNQTPTTSPQLQPSPTAMPSDETFRPLPPAGSDNSEGVIGKQHPRRGSAEEDAEDEKAEEVIEFDEGLESTGGEDSYDYHPLYVDEDDADEIFERVPEGTDADADDEVDVEFLKTHLADKLWWEEYRRSLGEDDEDFE